MLKSKYPFQLVLVIGFLFALITPVCAVPAHPEPIERKQSDGTTLTLLLHGDEHFHYTTTLDGYLLREDDRGDYFYYDSSVKAHNPEQRPNNELNFLSNFDNKSLIDSLEEQSKAKDAHLRSNVLMRLGQFPSEGDQRSLVILVEFNDNTFSVENPNQAFSNLLNQPGYSENGATGSSRDYFIENSGGKFRPQFDVYGPVKLPKNMYFYGGDDNYGNDLDPRQMVIDACQILHETTDIDFSVYNNDKDELNWVDNIYIFYAGYGEADGGPAYTIWPHSWNIADYEIVYDGVTLATYACSSELINGTGKTMAGIGTFTHEFMHVLGLPDLYQTRKVEPLSFTPGDYSVLDHGPYNNNQRTPPYLTVYERAHLKWLDPIELNAPANIALNSIGSNEGFVIMTDNPDEHYLIENRQLQDWDTYIPGHGMVVWHIDFDSEIWVENKVNNDANHQRIDLIEADNLHTSGSRAGDPFPGTNGIIDFTDNTTPSMRTWEDKPLNTPITDIKEIDGVIYFRVMGGKDLEGKAIGLPATNIEQTSFTAHWEETDGAIAYLLSVYYLVDGEKIYVRDLEEKNMRDTLKYNIDGLYPGIEYAYQVIAMDAYSQTEPSDAILVETAAPTFEYYIPNTKPASEITVNSFVAGWDAVSEAESYVLNVYQKKQSDPEGSVTLDFTGKIAGIPNEWTTNCSSTFSTSGNFGETAPALRMDIDKHYIQSPEYDSGVSAFSFWYRGSNSAASNSLVVSGFNGIRWVKLRTIQPLVNTVGGEKISLDSDLLENYYAITLTYSKEGTGAVAIDDIYLEYGAETDKFYLSEYEDKNVGDALSITIENLDEHQTYYYTVTAYNGEIYSLPSKEIKVYTHNSVGLDEVNSSVIYHLADGMLYLQDEDDNLHQVTLYNLLGQSVFTSEFRNQGSFPVYHLPAGVYIIHVDGRSYKINIAGQRNYKQ